MRALKKPLPVEVWRIEDLSSDETRAIPGWVIKAVVERKLEACHGGLSIDTQEGEMLGKFGDWLIRGNPDGELWAVDAKIFDKTYDILNS
jgi:hypothetical protein